MTLTELVFEVADPRYPLCRLTAERPDCRAVYRIVDPGSSGVLRATLTVLCTPEVGAQLAKELQKASRFEELEIVSASPYAVVFKIGYRQPAPAADEKAADKAAGSPVVGLERLLDVFGTDTIFEPFFVQGGKIRVRAIVAEPLDTKRALVKLQELQRVMSWEEFRVVRVAEFQATRYAESMRRMLDPEQEDLLRLAVRLGYYESPKRCTLQDIAAQVGLSVSPIHKKLKNVEQVLVSAYIDPATAKALEPRRRGRGFPAPEDVGPGAMAELAIRAQWPEAPLAAFSAKHPGALLIVHPLAEDTTGGVALAIVVSPPQEYRELVEDLNRRPEVERADVVSRDTDHVSIKIRWRGQTQGADPKFRDFVGTRILRRVGRGAFLKPIIVEAGEVYAKAILTHPASPDEIRRRLEDMARDAGWRHWELLALRRVDLDPAIAATPTDRMTVRQTEILKIAHALGYYKTPRGCTLDEVAKTLGISANAIHKNLTAAEQKIVGSYLADAFWQC